MLFPSSLHCESAVRISADYNSAHLAFTMLDEITDVLFGDVRV